MINQAEYRAAMQCIRLLVPHDPELDGPLGQALDHLTHACEEYELANFPFAPPTPAELAIFRATEMGDAP